VSKRIDKRLHCAAANAAFLALLLYLAGGQPLRADPGIAWDALLQGQVNVESTSNKQGLPGLRAQFTVTATREAIWLALLDYDNFPKIFEGINKMQVLEQSATGARVEFWIDAKIKELHYILYRNYVHPGYKLSWYKTEGDLGQITGSWEISDTPYNNVYLIQYESFVDVGNTIATYMIRYFAKQRAQDMAARLRQWVEK
jgi:hypothetical protein